MNQIDESELYRLVGGIVVVVLVIWLYLIFTEGQANAGLLSQWQAMDIYADHHGVYLPVVVK